MPYSKPVVIVVEDDPSMLRALRRLIGSAGFEVSTYDRPSALLEANLPNSNACFVIDVNLPEMNGVELCRLLAARNHSLPIIFITAADDENTRELADSVNPVAFLIKPFPHGLLIDSISRALRATRSFNSRSIRSASRQ